MKKWKERWKEMLPYEKKCEVATGIFLFLAILAFLFEVLDKIGVFPVAIDPFVIGKVMLVAAQSCQAVVCWRKERNLAYAFMMVAICFGLGVIWDIVKLCI